MGVDRNSFLGPFMSVKFKSINTRSKRYTCINENCGEYNSKDFNSSDKFCHACGKELGDKTYTSSYIPDIDDLGYDAESGEYAEGFEWAADEFWAAIENESKIIVSRDGEKKEIKQREFEIYVKQGWVANKTRYDIERIYPLYIKTPRKKMRFDFDEGGGVGYVMPGDLELEVKIALEKYGEKIAAIRKMKGVVGVDINWGLINWYS